MTTLFSFFSIVLLAVGYHLQSPDGRLDVEVKADGQQLSFLLTQDRDTLLAESGIGLTLGDGSRIEASKVKSARRRKVSETIDATLSEPEKEGYTFIGWRSGLSFL